MDLDKVNVSLFRSGSYKNNSTKALLTLYPFSSENTIKLIINYRQTRIQEKQKYVALFRKFMLQTYTKLFQQT